MNKKRSYPVLLNNSVVAMDNVLSGKAPDDRDYVYAEFLCSIMNLKYVKDRFIFDILRNEYMVQSKTIGNVLVFLKNKDDIECIRFIMTHKDNFSIFEYSYIERSVQPSKLGS